MPRLLAEVAGDPELHALFYEHLVEPRRRDALRGDRRARAMRAARSAPTSTRARRST